MPYATYQQVAQKTIEDRIRNRFRSEISTLEMLGFTELCFYSDISHPFSLVVFLWPMLTYLLTERSIVEIQSPLRVVGFSPLLASKDYTTYVTISTLGVEFYTNFADGTGLISASYKIATIVDDKRKLYRYSDSLTIESTWELHKERINKFKAGGNQIRDNICFEDYVEILDRADRESVVSFKVVELFLGVVVIYYGSVLLRAGEYIGAVVLLAFGILIFIKSDWGQRVKNDVLRKTIEYVSWQVLILGFIIQLIVFWAQLSQALIRILCLSAS